MFVIKPIRTGSSGNGTIITDNQTTILIDCGFSWNKAIQSGTTRSLQINKESVDAVFITHEHHDHISGLKEFAHTGIKVFMSELTFQKLNKDREKFLKYLAGVDVVKMQPIQTGQVIPSYVINTLEVTPFKSYHDAADPLNYTVENSALEKIVYITDCGKKPKVIDDGDFYMIEANYSKQMLDEREMTATEILKQTRNNAGIGHLSAEEAMEYIDEVKQVNDKDFGVLLIHANPEFFLAKHRYAGSEYSMLEPKKWLNTVYKLGGKDNG